MLGKVDVVLGSFSPVLASRGGFVPTKDASVFHCLERHSPSNIFLNGLSTTQVAVAQAACELLRGEEGVRLRGALVQNVSVLRHGLRARGSTLLGGPSAIVPVFAGREAVGRLTQRIAAGRGILVDLVGYPTVSLDRARLRLRVRVAHAEALCSHAAEVVHEALAEARAYIGTED